VTGTSNKQQSVTASRPPTLQCSVP